MKKGMIVGVLISLVVAVRPAMAVFGVGDVVIVASNPAQEMLWASEELPKWIEMIKTTQQQVNKAQELVNIVGNPKEFAGQIISASAPMLALTEDANQLAARKAVVDFTRSSWTLYNSTKQLTEDVLNVDENYKVFGREVKRDREKYVRLATEKALQVRLQEAIQKKHEVDKRELALQQETLQAIKASTSQTQIAVLNSMLTASQQRMQIAAARVTQAQSELDVFKGNLALEQAKEHEQAKEWAGQVVDTAVKEAEKAMCAGGNAMPLRPIGRDGWNAQTF
jgi:hypothetical protein